MRTRNTATLAVATVVVAGVAVGYVATRGSSPAQVTTRPAVVPTMTASRAPVLEPLPSPSATAGSVGVGRAISRLASAPGIGRVLGADVVDATTGRGLFARSASTPVPPASTVKLMTATAALLALGPDATLTTSTASSGSTVYLVGGGDVTLSGTPSTGGYPQPASLVTLARRTAQRIGPGHTVRLRLDVSAWRGPATAPGWQRRYFTEGDIVSPSPLVLDEGRVAPSTEEAPRVADPALAAGERFAQLLAASHVRVRGRPRLAAAPAAATPLAAVASPTVSQLVQFMLTTSDNDLAEALGRAVAIHDHLPADFAGEARAVTNRMVALGVPSDELRLDDASGLSRLDRVAPAALIDVLRADLAANHPVLRPVVEGLPVAGFSGTLAPRYRASPTSHAAGVLRAKTGTLTGVSALAGFVVDRDDELLLFDFVASRALSTETTESALDRLAARLAGCGCVG